MQVILTHEQADFDAIASLLGASLLQPDALAALPTAMNRNVRDFVHLYAAELPFRTVDELPRQEIDTLTIVDTQSLVTLKGLKKDTKIFVVDHHSRKHDLSPDWHFTPVTTGACTTYFVEHLQEVNGPLSMVHATLLLTGIYEDSGTLTYANTTSRDVMAVAYLLEQGASLKIATEFLNPPLSLQQRGVFESLIENIQTQTLHGCRVFISHASAFDLEDEVSSIAHKISDLYDPDALFIFVETREGIRLVARSVTDQVNVAEITRMYDGGGHERAAAALIKREKATKHQLEKITADFSREISKFVKPAITVKQIMSKKPLLISPDTTAEEALDLMKKFGYEGYPVVREDEVVGLLTRRAVDRALSHKLNLPASSLMDAGKVSVRMNDSLDTLQRLMADSGWGQVPVIDPHSGKITAIVTRTDLLKSIAGSNAGFYQQQNLSIELEESIPPATMGLLRIMSMVASSLQLPIYLVGGFTRDLLLGAPSLDLDLVVEGDAIQLAQALAKQYGGKVTSHKKFGTAKWHLGALKKGLMKKDGAASPIDLGSLPATIDLVSARTEFYEKPTALPTVSKGSIKLDLHRRDFTINTMAIRLDGHHFGELYDYWGGLNDLKEKKVRVLHSLSFVDDPTRILRAIRFEKRFGFSIEKRTLELLNQARSLLAEVSGDRIRHELDQILKEPRAAEMLQRMAALGLIHAIHPQMEWNETIRTDFEKFLSTPIRQQWRLSDREQKEFRLYGAYIILLARLIPEALEQVCQRLHIKNHLKKNIFGVNTLWRNLERIKGLKASELTCLLQDYSQVVIACVYLISEDASAKKKLAEFATHWRWVETQTTGETLKELGLPPGPLFRKILDDLKAARINGDIHNDEDERSMLNDLLREYKLKAED